MDEEDNKSRYYQSHCTICGGPIHKIKRKPAEDEDPVDDDDGYDHFDEGQYVDGEIVSLEGIEWLREIRVVGEKNRLYEEITEGFDYSDSEIYFVSNKLFSARNIEDYGFYYLARDDDENDAFEIYFSKTGVAVHDNCWAMVIQAVAYVKGLEMNVGHDVSTDAFPIWSDIVRQLLEMTEKLDFGDDLVISCIENSAEIDYGWIIVDGSEYLLCDVYGAPDPFTNKGHLVEYLEVFQNVDISLPPYMGQCPMDVEYSISSDKLSFIEKLPTELYLSISQYLPPCCIANLRLSSKRIANVFNPACYQSFWRRLVIESPIMFENVSDVVWCMKVDWRMLWWKLNMQLSTLKAQAGVYRLPQVILHWANCRRIWSRCVKLVKEAHQKKLEDLNTLPLSHRKGYASIMTANSNQTPTSKHRIMHGNILKGLKLFHSFNNRVCGLEIINEKDEDWKFGHTGEFLNVVEKKLESESSQLTGWLVWLGRTSMNDQEVLKNIIIDIEPIYEDGRILSSGRNDAANKLQILVIFKESTLAGTSFEFNDKYGLVSVALLEPKMAWGAIQFLPFRQRAFWNGRFAPPLELTFHQRLGQNPADESVNDISYVRFDDGEPLHDPLGKIQYVETDPTTAPELIGSKLLFFSRSGMLIIPSQHASIALPQQEKYKVIREVKLEEDERVLGAVVLCHPTPHTRLRDGNSPLIERCTLMKDICFWTSSGRLIGPFIEEYKNESFTPYELSPDDPTTEVFAGIHYAPSLGIGMITRARKVEDPDYIPCPHLSRIHDRNGIQYLFTPVEPIIEGDIFPPLPKFAQQHAELGTSTPKPSGYKNLRSCYDFFSKGEPYNAGVGAYFSKSDPRGRLLSGLTMVHENYDEKSFSLVSFGSAADLHYKTVEMDRDCFGIREVAIWTWKDGDDIYIAGIAFGFADNTANDGTAVYTDTLGWEDGEKTIVKVPEGKNLIGLKAIIQDFGHIRAIGGIYDS